METKQRGSRWWIWGLSSVAAIILYFASFGPYVYLEGRFGPTPLLQGIGVVYVPLEWLGQAEIFPGWYKKYVGACVIRGVLDRP